ncbi:MAG: hypothetical protein HOP15_00690 [Planctomycetes bacterium]|nr:hypothetical protein [Planctomycetota bacterium]
MRSLFRPSLLLAFAFPVHAQEFTSIFWPPRDVGAIERFGEFFGPSLAVGGDVLAVRDTRDGENTFVRVYLREGLNWIEDGRLAPYPRTPFVPDSLDLADCLDVDAGRVLVGARERVLLYHRVAARQWVAEEIPRPAHVTGNGFGLFAALSGDWMAVTTESALDLLQRQGNGTWALMQEFPMTFPIRPDIDGSNLMVPCFGGEVRVLHRNGATWNEELHLAPYWDLPALDGERMCAVDLLTLQYRVFERVGTSWVPGAGLRFHGERPSALGFSDERMYVTQGGKLRVFDVASWGELGEIPAPFPSLCSFSRASLAVDQKTLVVQTTAKPVEHTLGELSTFDLSGATRATLHASHAQMELESGGTLTLELDAGPANAGKAWFLGGSLTGSSPGFRLAGKRIPLDRRADPYFDLCRYRGRLDGAGRASIAIQIPALAPGDPLCFLKDRTLHHAFFLWERGRGVTNVSNVAPTALVGRIQ